MNFQNRPPQANASEQKPAPTIEQSLKYMAWDVKGIVPAIKELTAEIRALRTGKAGPSMDNQENPF